MPVDGGVREPLVTYLSAMHVRLAERVPPPLHHLVPHQLAYRLFRIASNNTAH
jgi:hypothetical protein